MVADCKSVGIYAYVGSNPTFFKYNVRLIV